MAELILSPLLDVIFRLVWGVDKELNNLKSTLSAIQAVLEDAEDRQFEASAVKDWLGKFQDVAHDADDLVDEIATEARQSMIESGTEAGKKMKQRVRNFVSSCFSCTQVGYRRETAHRIREINERLDKIAKEKADLHLQIRCGNKHFEIREGRQLVGSVRDGSEVFGRENDQEQIIESLLSDDSGYRRKFSVIAIVGMGGQGKPTLAQLFYNGERVTAKFELRAWVCVSEDFDVMRLTKEIIESASGSACDLSSPDALQRRLHDILSGKTYLLVLDDLWNEKSSNWEKLQAPFAYGAKGSKIVVTTRSRAVSDLIQTTCTHQLEGLSKEACWDLFFSQAFVGDDDFNAYPRLVEIGKKLVEKCQAFPLAVKAVGGLLSFTREAREWENILNSATWCRRGEAEILPSLRLSYQHLPTHLKFCFKFCSIYPKYHVLVEEELVRMWIAHGFVRPEDGEQIEDTGSRYFNYLAQRSFFQSLFYGACTMHDLFHDLAQSISGKECSYMDGFEPNGVGKRARHKLISGEERANFETLYESKGLRTLLLQNSDWRADYKVPPEMFDRLRFIRVLKLSNCDIPDSIGNSRHLRYLKLKSPSITELPESICSIYNLQTFILCQCNKLVKLPDSVGNLRHLRYLKLENCSIKELPKSICTIYNFQALILFGCRELVKLPDSIADLRHLRELKLQLCFIRELPESICSIYNLQTLKLSCCYNLVKLPNEMSKLINLRHLNLDSCSGLKSMPPRIGRLTCLEKFSLFAVGRERETGIAELKELTDLRGNLEIRNLENVEKAEAARQANLKSKRFIDKLTLQWNRNTQDERLQEEVAEELQPPPKLKELIFDGYMGACFPSWMMTRESDVLLPNLTTVELYGCRRCSMLPPLGQLPSLVDLTIGGMDGVKQIEEGRFLRLRRLRIYKCPQLISLPQCHSLEELELEALDNLEEWCGVGEADFRSLRKLSVRGCPKMREWPGNLSALTELSVSRCWGFDAVALFPSLRDLTLGESSDRLWSSVSCPTSLSSLSFQGLELTAVHRGNLQALTQLKILSLFRCDKLEALLEDGLQNGGLPPSLTRLNILGCFNPKSLPRGLHALTSLRTLQILDCPEVTSLPEEELPPGLESLHIYGCPRLKERCQKDVGYCKGARKT